MAPQAAATQSANRATPGARPTEGGLANRVPPWDVEAEQSLLGSMLVDSDCVGLVLQIIPREESGRLYRHDHQLLYEALLDLYNLNKPIDLILLEDELRQRGTLNEIGGREYLLELHESVPSSANAEYYAKIVRDKSLLRDLIRCSGEIQHAAYDQSEPAADILDKAEQKLFDVTEKRVTNQPVTLKQFLDQSFHTLIVAENAITGIPTGFSALDELLGGFQFGDLAVIAARPSMGKTALGLSILQYIGIYESMPCAFFSMEMSKLQIAQRLLCSLGYVDMQNLRRGRLTEEDRKKLERARLQMQDKPVFIDDKAGMSLMELRAKTRRLKQLHDIRIVFVDYLQLMYDPSNRENRQQEVASISRGLKALGRELNIPIVALAQLNREVEGRAGNRPRMSDLRESGAIEQDADVIILLHREKYHMDKKLVRSGQNDIQSEVMPHDESLTELIVEKQRNGPTGIVNVHFTSQYARFDNQAHPRISDASEYEAMSLNGEPIIDDEHSELKTRETSGYDDRASGSNAVPF